MPTKPGGDPPSLPAEVHEHPAEVVLVLLDPVVERFDVLALEAPQDVLLQLACSLVGVVLVVWCLLRDGRGDDPRERPGDLPAAVVDVAEVQLQLHSACHQPSTGGGSVTSMRSPGRGIASASSAAVASRHTRS